MRFAGIGKDEANMGCGAETIRFGFVAVMAVRWRVKVYFNCRQFKIILAIVGIDCGIEKAISKNRDSDRPLTDAIAIWRTIALL